MHALFNKNLAKNTWTLGANTLRSFVEYFGANTEYLDISSENGRATFMSYTEKVMNGRGMCLALSCPQMTQLIQYRCLETTIADISHNRQSRFRELHSRGATTHRYKRQGLQSHRHSCRIAEGKHHCLIFLPYAPNAIQL